MTTLRAAGAGLVAAVAVILTIIAPATTVHRMSPDAPGCRTLSTPYPIAAGDG